MFAQKNVQRAVVIVVAVSMMLADADAQTLSRLSETQKQTVAQLKAELTQKLEIAKRSTAKCVDAAEIQQIVDVALNDIPSIFVGRNVVFSKKWISYVGNDGKKPLTEQQFSAWRNRVDRIYDCLEDLTGQPPRAGTKIFVNLISRKDSTGAFAAHAHIWCNIICFDWHTKNFLPILTHEIKYGSTYSTMIHEIAHFFSYREPWDAESESIVNVLMAYVLENTNLWYGLPDGLSSRISSADAYFTDPLTKGKQLRVRTYSAPLRRFESNTIEPFHTIVPFQSYKFNGAYDLYLLGLVEMAGWDAIKKGIRSYYDPSYKPRYIYQGDQKHVRARDFFDRIAHFSERPDVLQSLPDKGSLLDKCFPVTIIPVSAAVPSR